MEFITKSKEGVRAHKLNEKKLSSKQKEREKKKLRKLADKKSKQGKMRDIMASL